LEENCTRVNSARTRKVNRIHLIIVLWGEIGEIDDADHRIGSLLVDFSVAAATIRNPFVNLSVSS